jgi:arabinofuranan 3-O-arabinosyltransferase
MGRSTFAGNTREGLATPWGAHSECGVLTQARLQAYGYAIAIVYMTTLVHFYRVGAWILDITGSPHYTEFTPFWVAAVQAVHGEAASLSSPAEFIQIQNALLGAQQALYFWGYPPTYLLVLAPLGVLPYHTAFLSYEVVTLLGLIIVVCLIVRQSPAAVALVLASPYTLWNFLAGANGFLTASLMGASLLLLERRPVLSGAFLGCLTYKPHFGILFPVALLASKQWRVIASAVTTTVILGGASIIAFGTELWAALPAAINLDASLSLGAEPDSKWGYFQTAYGLARTLHSGAGPAWFGQAITTMGLIATVCAVWRSPVRHELKAATVSAAALIATPYAFSYDLAAIAIPVAFLAKDQIRHGVLRGEQIMLIGLFVAVLALLVIFRDPPDGIPFGSIPIGIFAVFVILGMVLRRVFCCAEPLSHSLQARSCDWSFWRLNFGRSRKVGPRG